MQSVPITTKVVSSNPAHGDVYLIQLYVIQFVCDLQQVGGFPKVLKVSTNKSDLHDITEILLKVALIITLTITLERKLSSLFNTINHI